MDREIPKELLFPKLRFKNVKEIEQLYEYGPSSDHDFFYSRPPHGLIYVERLKITVYCPFEFNNFPFDVHQCNLSFGLSSSGAGAFTLSQPNVKYGSIQTTSGTENIIIDSAYSPVPFDVEITSMETYNESEYGFTFSYSGLTMNLRRSDLGLLLGGYFVPTAIFALLSLVSFAVDLQMVPGRLGLLVTLYLIMTNVYISVEGPKRRGFSYIEIWYVGIQIPILIGIVEYAILLTMMKYHGKDGEQMTTKVAPENRNGSGTQADFKEIAKTVDKWIFLGSLLFTILFICTYWITHL